MLLPSEKVEGDLSAIDFVVEDTKGHAKEGYGLNNSTSSVAVVVRPDAMIAAFATSERGIDKYLTAVFSRS